MRKTCGKKGTFLLAAALALAGCFTSIADDDLAGGGTGSGGQAATYTVTFDSRNGSAVAPQRVEKGQTATEPAAPTKTDRTFGGWHLGEDAFDFATPITADTTLTAKWKIVVGEGGTYGIFKIDENGVVTGYDTKPTGDITIPEDVTGIGDWAFWDCSSLESVTIPGSVTSIGSHAFGNCSSLTSITIPDSVTSIGDYAFWDCNHLTSITIPNGVTSIGDGAFYKCSSLESVTIGDGVTSIGESAFRDCSSLESITIPGRVTSIGDYAFENCSSLASVTIPNGVTSIGGEAFWGCNHLTSITIPDSVTSIGGYAFFGCYLNDVYYGGSESAWEELMRNTQSGNDPLQNATIHYNSTGA